MSHEEFLLDTLEKLIKEWQGRFHLVMKSTPRVPGDRPLMAIRYKYKYWKVLGFVAAEGGGSTDPGNPYLSCFSDNYSNVYNLPVFFSSCDW